MKLQKRRIVAGVLSLLMLMPTQGMSALADTEITEITEITSAGDSFEEILPGETMEDTLPPEPTEGTGERIEETLPLEPTEETEGRIEETLPLEPTEETGERIEETLPLEPLKTAESNLAIYWNPGGTLPADLLASASDAADNSDVPTATASNAVAKAAAGSDRADGRTPAHPVKSLETAMNLADQLAEEEGMDRSDITIYAMNPMEVEEGHMYVLNAGNIRIASWPGRKYDSDTIFYLTGGQLALMNVSLEPDRMEEDGDTEEVDTEEAELVRIYGGALQLGRSVSLDGRIVMDYRNKKNEPEWELATGSDAEKLASDSNWTEEGAAGAGFDISEYIFSEEEDEWELLEDHTDEKTNRSPIIQLIEGFDGAEGSFRLELRGDSGLTYTQLAEALYADETSEEEFASYFSLADMEDEGWKLIPSSQTEAAVRDTTNTEDLARFWSMQPAANDGIALASEDTDDIKVTRKSLFAAKATSGYLYWNPGPGSFVADGITYAPGNDAYDGTTAFRAVRTWQEAVTKASAQNKTIVCMQPVELDSANADVVMPAPVGGKYVAESPSSTTIVPVMPWSTNPNPIFVVPAGETLELRNICMSGMEKDGDIVNAQAIYSSGGTIQIDEGVTAETGFIQMDADDTLKNRPIQVTSLSGGMISLYVGGINTDLSYRMTDVVVPAGDLGTAADADADAVGTGLLGRFKMETGNRSNEHGGQSKFDWVLRQDTTDDDGIAHPENLELYAEYYYDAVYLDGVRGDDTNLGATCQFPVKTWAKAKEIWDREMQRSIARRALARTGGMPEADIDLAFPMPKTIYICGTVTVEDVQEWNMDYTGAPVSAAGHPLDNGAEVITEVTSHIEIPDKTGAEGTPVHDLPTTLVEAKGSAADLTLRNIRFRNITDITTSVTVSAVEDASLTLKGTTSMTGTRPASTVLQTEEKDQTAGIHMSIQSGASCIMDASWTGALEKRQQGMFIDGAGTSVVMNGNGFIRKNNGDYSTTSSRRGAGVSVTGGASFTMNGGEITENTVYEYGGGIYADGTGTTVTINKGAVTKNTMAKIYKAEYDDSLTYQDQGYYICGKGIGIYAGIGTKLTLKSEDDALGTVSVSENTGYWVYGAGIYAAGETELTKALIKDNRSCTGIRHSASYPVSQGVGICMNSGSLAMGESEVSGNGVSGTPSMNNNAKGAGIYIGTTVGESSIIASEISGNQVGSSYARSENYSAGGGIYVYTNNKLLIKDTLIQENQAYAGGGIAICTYSVYNNTANVQIMDCQILKNRASYRLTRSSYNYGIGGGICYLGAGSLTEVGDGTVIRENTAYQGGGIYAYSSTSGGTCYNFYIHGTEEKPIMIAENSCESYGGGVCATSDRFYAEYAVVSGNKAGVDDRGVTVTWTGKYGGGLYSYGSRWYHCEFSGNEVLGESPSYRADGGGMYLYGGFTYMTNCQVHDNRSSQYGGGIAVGSGASYFNEDEPGAAALQDNTAQYGGGVSQLGGALYMDFSGTVVNNAEKQGHNIFMQTAGYIYLTDGVWNQPEDAAEGVHNVYLSHDTAGGSLIMDPNKVTIGKKSSGKAEAVYLDKTNSYLSYLQVPTSAEEQVLPIDVNTEVFNIGSIVIKPANLSTVSRYRVDPGYDKMTVSAPLSYTALKDASLNLPWSEGGILPRRTQLGGFKDALDETKINAVLLGEGVYLDGINGDDMTHYGTSPQDAVRTFAKAKEILDGKITTRAANDLLLTEEERTGYTPYIYLCGTVTIPNGKEETWDLDYTSTLYADTNKYFEISEKKLDDWKAGDADSKYKAQIRRFASFVTKPMIQVGVAASDQADLILNGVMIEGMADAVIQSTQGAQSPLMTCSNQSTVTMNGKAELRNNYHTIMSLAGKLLMTGDAGIVDGTDYYVSMTSSDAELELRDQAKILSQGKIAKAGPNMYGVHVQNIAKSDKRVKISLKGNSRIGSDDNAPERMDYGIYMYNVTDANIHLNAETEALETDSASIYGCGYGIMLASVGGVDMVMGRKAKLEVNRPGKSDGENAIYYQGVQGAAANTLIMRDESMITSSYTGDGRGIFIYGSWTPLHIQMQDHALITGLESGIRSPDRVGNYGIRRVRITMEGHAAISHCLSGIYDGGDSFFDQSTGDYFELTMKDYAVIGAAYGPADEAGVPDETTPGASGENMTYQSGNASTRIRSGNNGYGVYTETPMIIQMSDYAGIRYNGYGIWAGRDYSSGWYASGNGSMQMEDHANISYNYISGSSAAFFQSASEANQQAGMPNIWEVVLRGNASIKKNVGSFEVGNGTTLKLQEFAHVGSNRGTLAINSYGFIELDGRSTIGDVQADGSVTGYAYLQDGSRPITMTHEAALGKRYNLYLAEGFLGQVVVKPDGTHLTDLTGTQSQLPYFSKYGGAGLAASAEKKLLEQTPNIVLSGENNVYISTGGDDNSNGLTPSTAVRTFKRAKELLETGLFTEGANILVCQNKNSTTDNNGVLVLAGDTVWAFDAGGTVHNSKTNQTWKPVVKRYKEYNYGRLITIPTGMEMTFRDIAIDGGLEDGIVLSNVNRNKELLLVPQKAKATLEEGTVFRNNKITYSDSSCSAVDSFTGSRASALCPGIRVLGGTLEVNGAVLENLVREYSISVNANTIPVASAIECQDYNTGGLTYQGKVVMNSGRIEGNRSGTGTDKSGVNKCVGGALVVYNGGEFEMNGGMIAENEFRGYSISTAYSIGGGGLVVFDGKATINGGTIRDNTGYRGSGIYYYDPDNQTNPDSGVILAGGQVRGNQVNGNAVHAVQDHAPIFVGGGNFQLSGGGSSLEDPIYLDSTRHIVKVSNSIYQLGRKYRIYVNKGDGADQFKKGSAVVEPDGNFMKDVSGYLGYFEVASTPYVVDAGQLKDRACGTITGMTEDKCLILMKAVYIDGKHGDDTRDATVPAKSVETFERAKQCGEADHANDPEEIKDYYIIYVCDEIKNGASAVWKLPKPAYMCRYTGFQVYDSEGMPAAAQTAYHEALIRPDGNLTLEEFTVFGRRLIDTTSANGSSILVIDPGITVTVPEGANVTLARNNNTGTYTDKNGTQHGVSQKGGAVEVKSGGILDMKAGTINSTAAIYGGAVYLEADKTAVAGSYSFGHMKLANELSVDGSVYLDGTGIDTAAYIEPAESFKATTPLLIEMANDYSGRELVQYPVGIVPGSDEQGYYDYAASIKAIYDIVNRTGAVNILELEQRNCIYLDGQSGSDAADGSTPAAAVKTLERVYELIGTGKAGTVVFVVGTVPIESGEDITLGNIMLTDPATDISSYAGFYETGSGKLEIEGQVYFKRYSQPTAHDTLTGFEKDTLMDPLFDIKDGGKLSLNGIYVDGHSQESVGTDETLTAPAVEAESPLIRVEAGGEVACGYLDPKTYPNGTATYTLLTNNTNQKAKDTIPANRIGDMGGVDIYAGSSAGIELIGDHSDPAYGTVATHVAKAVLTQTQFRNLKLAEGIAGGADVYSDGELHVSDEVSFSGSVFLEGIGSTEEPEKIPTSRYIWSDKYGTPIASQFPLMVRDPYQSRIIQHFPTDGEISTGELSNTALFRLEEKVTEFFYVSRDEEHKYNFILSVPTAVYIDGINGIDNSGDAQAGSTPSNPVRSLKRAYELLLGRASHTIYVVNTIQITDSTTLTGTGYRGADGNVDLISTNKVQILRYMKPDFAVADETEAKKLKFDVDDFRGPLVRVGDGSKAVTLNLTSNVSINGHSEDRYDAAYPKEVIVTEAKHGGELIAKAPLVVVEKDSVLNLNTEAALLDNNNTYDVQADTVPTGANWLNGGAVDNRGTTNIDGGSILNVAAVKGSIAYQEGEFNILSGAANLIDEAEGAQNSFYLTSENRGTDSEGNTVWGTDHVLRSAVKIPDDGTFTMDMDRAEDGRDVVKFTDSAGYAPNTGADAEYIHFPLGTTVPTDLFLVQAEADETVLELRDWKILKAEVPANIYLVVHRKGTVEATTAMSAVRADTGSTELFSSPEYEVKNNGAFDMKVSVTGIENDNVSAKITKDVMNLKSSESQLTAGSSTDIPKNIYLAVKGLDTTGSSGSGFAFAKTALTSGGTAFEMGALASGEAGRFGFEGKVGPGFVDHYKDLSFPLTDSIADVQEYMRSTTGEGAAEQGNAAAKYLLKYRVEINPGRR